MQDNPNPAIDLSSLEEFLFTMRWTTCAHMYLDTPSKISTYDTIVHLTPSVVSPVQYTYTVHSDKKKGSDLPS